MPFRKLLKDVVHPSFHLRLCLTPNLPCFFHVNYRVRSANGTPITDPARLLAAPRAGEVASEAGHVVAFPQQQGQYYWRVYSGDKTTGGWLTSVQPRSAAWAREALALPPGNNADFIQRVFVPEGTMLQRSRALGVFGHRGGGEQFRLLEQLPAENFGPGVPFK